VTKKLKAKLEGTINSPGHANRIFSIKFCKTDPTIVASGGWDKTVIIWDINGKNNTNYIVCSPRTENKMHWTLCVWR
jgi:WD40 repeat protein